MITIHLIWVSVDGLSWLKELFIEVDKICGSRQKLKSIILIKGPEKSIISQ